MLRVRVIVTGHAGTQIAHATACDISTLTRLCVSVRPAGGRARVQILSLRKLCVCYASALSSVGGGEPKERAKVSAVRVQNLYIAPRNMDTISDKAARARACKFKSVAVVCNKSVS